MPKRLTLPDELYPLEAFFNRLSQDMFKRALENFINGTGYNPEDITCFLPREIAEDTGANESDINYVQIWTYAGDQEIEVPLTEFRQYLQRVLAAEHDPELKSLGDRALAALQAMIEAR